MLDAERAEPLRQFSFCPDQQRFVRESRRGGAHRGEHLQLQRSVRHMVLAAYDMGDAHLRVIDRRRQHVEPRSIGAADDRVAHRRGIELLGSPNQIVPNDWRIMVELEAPVRHDAIGLQRGAIGVAQRERRTVIDRRQAAPRGDLALQIELLPRLISGIDPPGVAQLLETRLIDRKARRLPLLAIGDKSEPVQIGANPLDETLFAARGIGIVDPQPEFPAIFARPQPAMQRGADVPDMQHAGGRRGETGADGHALALGSASERGNAPLPPAKRAPKGRNDCGERHA